jgi:hypothetical protein
VQVSAETAERSPNTRGFRVTNASHTSFEAQA